MAKILLVHGAWCDGSSWSGVVRRLQRAGHHVVAVQNPLTSLAEDIATTRRAIDALGGPLALVGHSYGGAVISGAGLDDNRVAGLVYVAAYMPDEGESVLGLGKRYGATAGAQAIRADAAGYLTLDPDLFGKVFADDVDPAEAAVLASVQHPTHGSCFGAPAALAAWRQKPSVVVRSANDQMVSPELQSWQALRAGSAVVDLDSSHASPVSHPDEVAAAIESVLG